MAGFKGLTVGRTLRWHRGLLWLAASALVLWGGSGLLHPLMVASGPQPVTMMPPPVSVDGSAWQGLTRALHGQGQIERVKWVASDTGPLLQLSLPADPVRQYWNANGEALPAATDRNQAIWLARHFTGREDAVIATELLTVFDDRYPAVNRQLPVWRIAFDGDDGTVAYIHTETATLAALTDSNKEVLQTAFRWFHTMSWLGDLTPLKLGLGSIWVGALLVTTLLGVLLLTRFRRRETKPLQRWHRRLAWLVVVPLMAMTLSGLHHLWQAEAGEVLPERTLVQAADVRQWPGADLADTALTHSAWRDLSMVASPLGSLLRAAPMPAGHHGPEHRFHGVPQEAPPVYFDVNGQAVDWDDQRQARWLAAGLLGIDAAQIASATAITHFSATYDFRNKRLPVWELSLRDAPARLAYVDTSANRIVDQLTGAEIVEALDFGLLHKWNWLGHSIGRVPRDLIQVTLVILAMVLGAVGIGMRRR